MFTNNENERNVIERIINNRHEINLIKIELINDTLTYTGKGVIFQDSDGFLLLKFFSDRLYSNDEQITNFFKDDSKDNPEGGFITDHYSLKGQDNDGKEYSCKRLIFRSGKGTNLSYLRLQSFLESNKEHGYYTRLIFAGNYNIPVNSMTKFKTNVGQTFWYTDFYRIWEIKIDDDVNIVFSKFDDYLDLVVTTTVDKDINYKYVENLIYALNFVIGVEAEPIYINISGKGSQLRARNNIYKMPSIFSSPLIARHSYGDDFTMNHTNLFGVYFSYLQNNPETTLQFIHKRVISASRSYLYIMALVVAVQIENICKANYSEYYCPDNVFNNTVEECTKLIENSSIENKEDVIIKLRGMINNGTNRTQINMINILKNLSEKKIIDASLIKPWKDLRNITAHGDSYKNGDNSKADLKLLTAVFSCINLYYQLVFHLIGYSGYYSWKDYKENRLEKYPLTND